MSQLQEEGKLGLIIIHFMEILNISKSYFHNEWIRTHRIVEYLFSGNVSLSLGFLNDIRVEDVEFPAIVTRGSNNSAFIPQLKKRHNLKRRRSNFVDKISILNILMTLHFSTPLRN